MILADVRRIFIRGGPATRGLRESGLIMASGDRMTLDAEAIKVIGS